MTIVYTSDTCASCKQVKKLLDLKNKRYEERNIDEHPEYHDEVKRLSGQLRVPVTVINERVVVGYNPASITQAY